MNAFCHGLAIVRITRVSFNESEIFHCTNSFLGSLEASWLLILYNAIWHKLFAWYSYRGPCILARYIIYPYVSV